MSTVGVAQLRQNLSKFLKQVEAGESLVVTDHNVPVARLVPLAVSHERVVVTPATRRVLPESLPPSAGHKALSEALGELRDDR